MPGAALRFLIVISHGCCALADMCQPDRVYPRTTGNRREQRRNLTGGGWEGKGQTLARWRERQGEDPPCEGVVQEATEEQGAGDMEDGSRLPPTALAGPEGHQASEEGAGPRPEWNRKRKKKSAH